MGSPRDSMGPCSGSRTKPMAFVMWIIFGCVRYCCTRFRDEPYLFKGYNPETAKKIAEQVPPETVFYRVTDDAEHAPRWVADAGVHELVEKKKSAPEAQARAHVAAHIFLLAHTKEVTVRRTKFKGSRKDHPVQRQTVLE